MSMSPKLRAEHERRLTVTGPACIGIRVPEGLSSFPEYICFDASLTPVQHRAVSAPPREMHELGHEKAMCCMRWDQDPGFVR